MMATRIKAVLGILVALCYVALSVFGLLRMTHHMSHDSEPMISCPYMAGEHSICSMNTLEHILSWQNATTTLPWVVSIFTVILVAFFSIRFLDPPNVGSELYIKKRKKEKITPLFSLLYSEGLLNPKVL